MHTLQLDLTSGPESVYPYLFISASDGHVSTPFIVVHAGLAPGIQLAQTLDPIVS